MLAGKQPIYFCVANNNGQKVSKIPNNAIIYSSTPPTNLLTVTTELVLDGNYSYPCKLSIMIASLNAGDEGKGSFFLKIYSTDQKFSLTQMP